MRILLTLFLFLAVFAFGIHAADANLINALIQTESSGRDNVVGDGGAAIGPLQIHAGVVTDVNRIYKTKYTHKDMYVRENAIDVCTKYLTYYGSEKRLGRPPTNEDLARIWNGGPNGYKKKATAKYWIRVQKHL